MNLIPIAQSHRDADVENGRTFARRMATLGFVAVLGALPFGEAVAARMSGGIIPPNPSTKSSKSSAASVQAARPVKQQAAKTQKPAMPAPAAKSSARPNVAAKPQATPKVNQVSVGFGGGFLGGGIPPNPSAKPSAAAAQPARPVKQESAKTADQAIPARAPQPIASTNAAATASKTTNANPSRVGQDAGALSKPVKTEYIKGSDGHEITVSYFRNPDGTLYKTLLSPAASPPPNTSAPRAAPPSTQQTQQSSSVAPSSSAGNSVGGAKSQSNADSGGIRDKAPSGSTPAVSPRGVIPPDILSPTRTEAQGGMTVMVPDSTSAATPDRTAALRTRPPRQGMDVVDRSIGEFDAARAAPSDPASGLADSDAGRDTRQAQTGEAAGARAAAQPAADEQVSPRNRRSRLARSTASSTAAATRENIVQPKPLLFGSVTRSSFVLARTQAPGTATRGVHLALPAKTADSSNRPGEVNGRGTAQVADLGRGSPTYGAAPDVFASTGEPPKSASVACKARPSARHTAQRRAADPRATACS